MNQESERKESGSWIALLLLWACVGWLLFLGVVFIQGITAHSPFEGYVYTLAYMGAPFVAWRIGNDGHKIVRRGGAWNSARGSAIVGIACLLFLGLSFRSLGGGDLTQGSTLAAVVAGALLTGLYRPVVVPLILPRVRAELEEVLHIFREGFQTLQDEDVQK